ncbi:MAG: helix-turn-helix domain-containing protein [Holosporaceae bacterium]|jgi:transcriptional regulator with XRE-family HTH domain|nr:helix-turn-helix domain-containing protein [Holosporaceae bacterium]
MPNIKPNDIDKLIGQNLRYARRHRNVTQEKLAEELGITFQQVQKYEKGENKIFTSRLFKISQILNIPFGFFFLEGEKKPNEEFFKSSLKIASHYLRPTKEKLLN